MRIQKQIDRLLSDQASQWLEVLRTAGPKEQAEFNQWLRQSRLHVEEFLQMAAVDHALGELDSGRRVDVDALIAQITPGVTPLQAGRRETEAAGRPRWRSGLALAAGLAVAALAVPMYLKFSPGTGGTIATAEQLRTVTLDDGSVVTLNSASRIRIAYSERERNVELQAGEAVFQVAREASRPFQVHTPTAIVRAVGTQFNVNRQGPDTIVSVMEGRVRVVAQLKDQPGLAAPVAPGVEDLNAGEEARVEATGRIQKKARPDIAAAIAWQRRSLMFEETPLAEIAAQINRHSAVKLRLEGDEVGLRRYGGIFSGTDPQSLAAVLEREPDLIVERRAGEIVVRQR